MNNIFWDIPYPYRSADRNANKLGDAPGCKSVVTCRNPVASRKDPLNSCLPVRKSVRPSVINFP